MSLINKEVSDFSVQAYQNGEFRKVSKSDIIGKWSVFFFYPADFTLRVRQNLEDTVLRIVRPAMVSFSLGSRYS